jgi:hypothetical protein
MSADYVRVLSRRATLQWLAASALAAGIPRPGTAAAPDGGESARLSPGYGTDPDLKDPVVTWSLVMTTYQLQQTAVLTDLILPGSTYSPAPSALGVPDFVNEWVSAPYPDQVQDRNVILDGLEWIDAEAMRRDRQGFLELNREAQSRIVEDIARRIPEPQFAAQATFFKRLRYIVVGAYYTTPEGFKDIGYIGNVPLPSYPAATEEERRILDGALAKLGLLHA